ncbi:MAG: hypothetical protein PHS07_03020 [Patescibacteria group bacterium]|nr:hypothetical protein [Patescibacteria group bacterium]
MTDSHSEFLCTINIDESSAKILDLAMARLANIWIVFGRETLWQFLFQGSQEIQTRIRQAKDPKDLLYVRRAVNSWVEKYKKEWSNLEFYKILENKHPSQLHGLPIYNIFICLEWLDKKVKQEIMKEQAVINHQPVIPIKRVNLFSRILKGITKLFH